MHIFVEITGIYQLGILLVWIRFICPWPMNWMLLSGANSHCTSAVPGNLKVQVGEAIKLHFGQLPAHLDLDLCHSLIWNFGTPEFIYKFIKHIYSYMKKYMNMKKSKLYESYELETADNSKTGCLLSSSLLSSSWLLFQVYNDIYPAIWNPLPCLCDT